MLLEKINALLLYELLVVITDESSLPPKPDPCKEVCNILVKIADLGNACWTVSGTPKMVYPRRSIVSWRMGVWVACVDVDRSTVDL